MIALPSSSSASLGSAGPQRLIVKTDPLKNVSGGLGRFERGRHMAVEEPVVAAQMGERHGVVGSRERSRRARDLRDLERPLGQPTSAVEIPGAPVRGAGPRKQEGLVGRFRPVDAAAGEDGLGLLDVAAVPVQPAHAPGEPGRELLLAGRGVLVAGQGLLPPALQRMRLPEDLLDARLPEPRRKHRPCVDDGIGRPAHQEPLAVLEQKAAELRRLVALEVRAERVLQKALSLEPPRRAQVQRAKLVLPQTEPFASELPDHRVEREQPGLVARDEEPAAAERLDRDARLDDLERLAQLDREVLERRNRRDEPPDGRRLPVEHLSGEIVEERALRPVQGLNDRRADIGGGLFEGANGKPHGGRPAAGQLAGAAGLPGCARPRRGTARGGRRSRSPRRRAPRRRARAPVPGRAGAESGTAGRCDPQGPRAASAGPCRTRLSTSRAEGVPRSSSTSSRTSTRSCSSASSSCPAIRAAIASARISSSGGSHLRPGVDRNVGDERPQRAQEPTREGAETTIGRPDRVPPGSHVAGPLGDQRRLAVARTGDDGGQAPAERLVQPRLEPRALDQRGSRRSSRATTPCTGAHHAPPSATPVRRRRAGSLRHPVAPPSAAENAGAVPARAALRPLKGPAATLWASMQPTGVPKP